MSSADAPAAAAPPLRNLRPFTIDVPQSDIEYLQRRLAAARALPSQLEDIRPWEDGTDRAYFEEFLEYWKTQYDWCAWEAKLNAMGPQFLAEVNGVDVHFVHVRAAREDAAPLLLIHGWPGSFFEFYKVLPALAATGRFHLVVPSLPGYGFSSAPKKRGFGITQIAAALDALMQGLGYDRYWAQGGDYGAVTCRALSRFHADSCRATHVNMVVAWPSWRSPLSWAHVANLAVAPRTPLALTATELANVQALRRFQARETAYQKIQGTKPQTLAYALHDSPVGLAAWILEKFQTWTDSKGGSPDACLSKDEMLTNISIYWFSGCIASSIRLYKETLANRKEMAAIYAGYCGTPTGAAILPAEIVRPPRAWAAAMYNLQQWTELDKGGHFAALEQPELLTAEIVKFADLVDAKGWLKG